MGEVMLLQQTILKIQRPNIIKAFSPPPLIACYNILTREAPHEKKKKSTKRIKSTAVKPFVKAFKQIKVPPPPVGRNGTSQRN